MKNQNSQVKFATNGKSPSGRLETKANQTLDTTCRTDGCKRVRPKFWLTWCNIKTIIMLGIIIYLWLTN